ncbi:pali-domain-containing protein [Meredithblackwellia eburnea MCA 4105]
MGFIHVFGLLLILGATVMLIIVSVGLPVWDSVYFLKANLNGQLIRMGQWGVCIGNQCSHKKLGYDLSFIQETAAGDTKAGTTIVHGLSYALVLNPIAAAFSLLALLFALSSHFVLGIFAALLSFFAFLVTLVALAIDLGLFVTAHHRLTDQGATNVEYHNALWFVVASCVALFLASFTVCWTRNENRKSRALERDVETRPMVGGRNRWWTRNNRTTQPVMTEPVVTGRRHWWQRNRTTTAY